jgi:hypothetical protein
MGELLDGADQPAEFPVGHELVGPATDRVQLDRSVVGCRIWIVLWLGKRPMRRAFVVLYAIRARPEDLISLTGLLPIWLPKGALPTGVTVSWCGRIRCDLHRLHRRRSGTPSGGSYAMAGGQRSS